MALMAMVVDSMGKRMGSTSSLWLGQRCQFFDFFNPGDINHGQLDIVFQ
jgi:hypothetical protein